MAISGGEIYALENGADALCAINGGTTTISETSIKPTSKSLPWGLHLTNSCLNLATDRGEGIIS